jgi:hypothetical protein
MDELCPTLLCSDSQKVFFDIENKIFLFWKVLICSVFKWDLCAMVVARVFCLLVHGVLYLWGLWWGSYDTSKIAPGSPGGLGRDRCILVKYFQFGRILVLCERSPWLFLGCGSGLRSKQCWALSQWKSWHIYGNDSPRRVLIITRHAPSLLSSVCVWEEGEQLELHPEGTLRVVVYTQLLPALDWSVSLCPCPESLWEGSFAT